MFLRAARIQAMFPSLAPVSDLRGAIVEIAGAAGSSLSLLWESTSVRDTTAGGERSEEAPTACDWIPGPLPHTRVTRGMRGRSQETNRPDGRRTDDRCGRNRLVRGGPGVCRRRGLRRAGALDTCRRRRGTGADSPPPRGSGRRDCSPGDDRGDRDSHDRNPFHSGDPRDGHQCRLARSLGERRGRRLVDGVRSRRQATPSFGNPCRHLERSGPQLVTGGAPGPSALARFWRSAVEGYNQQPWD